MLDPVRSPMPSRPYSPRPQSYTSAAGRWAWVWMFVWGGGGRQTHRALGQTEPRLGDTAWQHCRHADHPPGRAWQQGVAAGQRRCRRERDPPPSELMAMLCQPPAATSARNTPSSPSTFCSRVAEKTSSQSAAQCSQLQRRSPFTFCSRERETVPSPGHQGCQLWGGACTKTPTPPSAGQSFYLRLCGIVGGAIAKLACDRGQSTPIHSSVPGCLVLPSPSLLSNAPHAGCQKPPGLHRWAPLPPSTTS